MRKRNLSKAATYGGAHHRTDDLLGVLDSKNGWDELLAGRTPLWVRLGASALGPSLDVQLAEGLEPDASPLLAARALHLSSRAFRRAMADSWLDVLSQSRERMTPFDPRVRPLRRRVFEAEGQIRALADALVAPLITAKGVAMASSLLCDGAGPLYNPGSVVDLRSVLSEVLRDIDPLFTIAS